MTRRVRRRLLVVAHTLVSVQRLLDVVELVEGDQDIQTVYTCGPDVFGHGVADYLHSIGAMTTSWRQAVSERFDLALAAAYGGLPELHAPIMVLPHGAGYAKRTPRAEATACAVEPPVYGLGPEQLVSEGRVVPSSILLPHDSHRDLLARSCPQAVPVAVVAGDPCYDRLHADLRHRAAYREALGMRPGQRLLVVSATWGAHSLFERHRDLFARLLDELDPRRYRIAAQLHPAVWSAHGARQIQAWLADERSGGLLVVEPQCGWRAMVAAADYVIGDHGSMPTYAASTGIPVLLVDDSEDVDEHSAQWLVRRRVRTLDVAAALPSQIRRAAVGVPRTLAIEVAARITSVPGQAQRLLRAEMYRLLGMPVPGRHRAIEPDPPPEVGGARRHAG
ncbi:MAG TPA: hypothetical protein VFW65_03360 [Pseudonocardiaceae bacterium]|nr:hypothetical protein [Pseudonocardiaceae bacterium]